jgi:hypothetical protein
MVDAVIGPPLVDGPIAPSRRHRGEVSDLDFEVKILDFTTIVRRGILGS